MTTESIRVYVADVRNERLFYCPDMRKWFDKHGLSFSDFLTNGISAEELLSKSNNDALAVKAVEVATLRRQEGK